MTRHPWSCFWLLVAVFFFVQGFAMTNIASGSNLMVFSAILGYFQIKKIFS
jgi:hypothetical protein